jgi:hypothetical protein
MTNGIVRKGNPKGLYARGKKMFDRLIDHNPNPRREQDTPSKAVPYAGDYIPPRPNDGPGGMTQGTARAYGVNLRPQFQKVYADMAAEYERRYGMPAGDQTQVTKVDQWSAELLVLAYLAKSSDAAVIAKMLHDRPELYDALLHQER